MAVHVALEGLLAKREERGVSPMKTQDTRQRGSPFF